MKKVFLTIVCAAIAVSASAQLKIEAGVDFGGFNKMSGFNTAPGFFVNGLYDIPVGSRDREAFYVETGIGFLMNNVEDSSNGSGVKTSWLKVPVLFGSDYQIGKGALTAAVGVYYAYGLAGKIDNSGVALDIMHNGTEAINIFKPHDFGVEAKAGYTFGMGLGIFVDYQLGIANIAAQSYSDAKTDIFGIGLNFKF